MSAIVNARTPSSRIARFSPSSTSRSPMKTIRAGSTACAWSAKCTGIPWTFPDGEVNGVLMSPCASTQITPGARPRARATPAIVPIAIE